MYGPAQEDRREKYSLLFWCLIIANSHPIAQRLTLNGFAHHPQWPKSASHKNVTSILLKFCAPTHPHWRMICYGTILHGHTRGHLVWKKTHLYLICHQLSSMRLKELIKEWAFFTLKVITRASVAQKDVTKARKACLSLCNTAKWRCHAVEWRWLLQSLCFS